jgi:hypothetical protein
MAAKTPLSDSASARAPTPAATRPSTRTSPSRRHGKKPKVNYEDSQFIPTDAIERTDDENEFMLALERYKRDGHPHPTWEQVLDVLHALGYTVTREVEAMKFKNAMERYRSDKKRPFPTWSEVFGVAQRMGYARRAPVTTHEMATRAEAALETASENYRLASQAHHAAAEPLRTSKAVERAAAKHVDMTMLVSVNSLAALKAAERSALALRAAAPAPEPVAV